MKSVYWLCVLMISNFLFNINIGVFGRFLHHSLPPHSATFYSPSFSKSHSLFDQKPKNEKKNESRETNKTNKKKKTKTKNKTTVFVLTALSAYDGPVNRASLSSPFSLLLRGLVRVGLLEARLGEAHTKAVGAQLILMEENERLDGLGDTRHLQKRHLGIVAIDQRGHR